MSNAAYTPPEGGSEGGPRRTQSTGVDGMRSATDRLPQNSSGVGETPRLAIGNKVRHRLSGATGEIVDLHRDPFVKDVTHGIVNWIGDGDGFGQGYADTNLIKF